MQLVWLVDTSASLISADDAEGEFAGRTTLADGLKIRMAGLLPRVIQSEAAMLADRSDFIRRVTDLVTLDPPLALDDPPTEVGGIITFNLNCSQHTSCTTVKS